MSEIDTQTFEQLSLAPAHEIVAAARADNLQVSLTPTQPHNIGLFGKPPKIKKWTPIFKLRKADVITELLTEDADEAEMIIGDISSCPSCGSIIAPEPAIQVGNYKLWQQGMSELWRWSDAELGRLQQALQPGDLLLWPSYAQSCTIKRSNGVLETWPRTQA